MNANLIQVVMGIKPSPDSILARAIEAAQAAEDSGKPFSERLDQRQAELESASRIIALAAWDTLPEVIDAAQRRQNALTVIIPKIQEQVRAALVNAQNEEAALDNIANRVRAVARFISELADDNIAVKDLSPRQREQALSRLRTELLTLIGRDSASFAEQDAESAARQWADLQAQVSRIESARFATPV